jgi:hypothetical protein
MLIERYAAGGLQAIGLPPPGVGMVRGPRRCDQSGALEALNGLIERARSDRHISLRPRFNVELDPISVLRTVDEGQQHFKRDGCEISERASSRRHDESK